MSTPARGFEPNDGGKTEGELKNPRYEHEEAIFDFENTKLEASSKPPNENLHEKSPILYSGFINSSNKGDSEIGLLKSKFEKFADYVTTKLAYLAYELNGIKENKPYSIVVLESVIDELKKEKSELWKTNDELRKHNTHMSHTITELRVSNKNLENEKLSLLTALQLIQNDYNQCSITANTAEKHGIL